MPIARHGKSHFPMDVTAADWPLQIAHHDVDAISEGPSDKEREVRQLPIDRLYALMTRARDCLYLFADEEQCEGTEAAYASIKAPYRIRGL